MMRDGDIDTIQISASKCCIAHLLNNAIAADIEWPLTASPMFLATLTVAYGSSVQLSLMSCHCQKCWTNSNDFRKNTTLSLYYIVIMKLSCPALAILCPAVVPRTLDVIRFFVFIHLCCDPISTIWIVRNVERPTWFAAVDRHCHRQADCRVSMENFTARRYAIAVYAVVVCLCVHPFLCHTLVLCQNGWT